MSPYFSLCCQRASAITRLDSSNSLQHCAGAVRASILYAIDETWSYNAAVTLAGVQNAVPIPADGRGNASVVPNILSTLPVTLYMNGMFKDELEAAAWSWVNLYPACTDTDKRIAIQASPCFEAQLSTCWVPLEGVYHDDSNQAQPCSPLAHWVR